MNTEKKWCPTCGKLTHHVKFTGETPLLIYSGELVDGVPVQPDVEPDNAGGCPYWKNKCTIHQGNHHFEVSPDHNSGIPVKRVPKGLTSQSCRPPREGELVCCECLDVAENGVGVQDLQKELDTYRQKIYSRALLRNIGRRYVVNRGSRPERMFSETEADLIRHLSKTEPEEVLEHKDPVHCHCCGTRIE